MVLYEREKGYVQIFIEQEIHGNNSVFMHFYDINITRSLCVKIPWVYRMVILLLVGGCLPVLITTTLNHYFGYGVQKSMELTFVLCIPIAAWMAHKINERWHDDREE